MTSLINAFLHLQTSPYLQQYIVFTGHLHAVVSHFASLGAIARNYLLKTKTLNRLLRILLTHNGSANLPQAPQSDTTFMIENLPLIEISRDPEEEETGYLMTNFGHNIDARQLMKERINL